MKKLSLCVLCALVGLLAGCRHSINSFESAEKTVFAQPITDLRFVVRDETLAKHVALLSIDTARNANNLLEVQVVAANCIHKPAKIKYQFMWFNSHGMQVKTVTSDWEKATLIPGEKLYIRRVAPQPDCADFKINLIYDK